MLKLSTSSGATPKRHAASTACRLVPPSAAKEVSPVTGRPRTAENASRTALVVVEVGGPGGGLSRSASAAAAWHARRSILSVRVRGNSFAKSTAAGWT